MLLNLLFNTQQMRVLRGLQVALVVVSVLLSLLRNAVDLKELFRKEEFALDVIDRPKVPDL
jgi:hypothetical protein